MTDLPHAIVYNGQPVCWCGVDHNDDPTFVVSRRDATDLEIKGSPRALIRDGRPDDAHPGYQADDDTSGLPPVPGSLRDVTGCITSATDDRLGRLQVENEALTARVGLLLVRVQEAKDELGHKDQRIRQQRKRLAELEAIVADHAAHYEKFITAAGETAQRHIKAWREASSENHRLRLGVQEAERAHGELVKVLKHLIDQERYWLADVRAKKMAEIARRALNEWAALGGDVPQEKLLTGKHPKRGGEATVALYDDEGNLVGGDVQEQPASSADSG